jgi:hypothetical protein
MPGRLVVSALASALLLAWMLSELPEELATLAVIDETILEDEAGRGSEAHDATLPQRIVLRLTAAADPSKGPGLLAAEGVVALHCPRAGAVRDVRLRARERLAAAR